MGYDPAKFTAVENGYVSPISNQQPAMSADSMIPNKRITNFPAIIQYKTATLCHLDKKRHRL